MTAEEAEDLLRRTIPAGFGPEYADLLKSIVKAKENECLNDIYESWENLINKIKLL